MRRKYNRKYSFERFIWSILSITFSYVILTVFLQHQATSNPLYARIQPPVVPPWFWAAVTVMIEAIIIYYIYQYYRLRKAGIRDIDKMTGDQFEEKLCVLFRQLGYGVNHFSKDHRGNEYGVDLKVEKDGVKTAVQAKRFGVKEHVDNTAVEKLVAGKALLNCDHALVVTNSVYTDNARYVGDKLNVELWDRRELINKLIEVSSK